MGVIVLADDVALISTCREELQTMLNLTYEYSCTWRYKINPDKSAIVVINKKEEAEITEWKLGDTQIKECSKHPLLGIMKCSSRFDPTNDIISKGYSTFFSLTGTKQGSQRLLPHICSHLWRTFCIPRMLYGVQVHRLTGYMLNRLDHAQNLLFKRILGLPKSCANEAVYLLPGLNSNQQTD